MKTKTPTAIARFFGRNAPQYEAAIVPAFHQFAASVLDTARLAQAETVLDVGTGTGILARLFAPHAREVVGLDIAQEMIEVARLSPETPPNVNYLVGDAHHAPFPDGAFSGIVASFGLNATEPRVVFPSLRRILAPDGVLAFHEWSIQHEIDSRLIDILAAYMVEEEDAPPDLLALREFIRTPRRWDNLLQDSDDFADALSRAGFQDIEVWEDAPVDCHLPLGEFMAYKLAWVNRQAELAAMEDYQRGDCLDAIRAMLSEYADEEGEVHYQPMLFRVRARREKR